MQTVTVISELLVAAALASTVLRHLRHGVIALSLQGFLLASLVALTAHGVTAILTIALVVAAKAVAVPWLLQRTARRTAAFETMEVLPRYVYLGVLAVLLTVRALDPGLRAVLADGRMVLLLPAALGVTLLGLVVVVTRQLLPSQMLGLALMENGIYAAGLAVANGLPIVLDAAILLDLMLALFLLAWLSGRVHAGWGHINADQLDHLRG